MGGLENLCLVEQYYAHARYIIGREADKHQPRLELKLKLLHGMRSFGRERAMPGVLQ